jgi:hypothetical protein
MTAWALLKNRKGVTLVELLVSGIVALVVVGAVFYFVSYSGEGTKQIAAVQQLQQESALISEVFMRNVRNGNFICVGTSTTAPTANTSGISTITIRDKSGNPVTTFGIIGDSLAMNGVKYLTSYLCKFRLPASNFTVYQNGKNADFFLSMYKVLGDDTIYYTQVIGDVRCKN